MSLDASGYVEAITDNIMNNQKNLEDIVVIRSSNTSRRGTVYTLVTKEVISNKNPLVVYTKKLEQEVMTLSIDKVGEPTTPLYYTYAKGELQGIYTSPAEAVIEADAQVGVVLNSRQQLLEVSSLR